MVSRWINNDEVESEALYVYDGRLENDANNVTAAAGLEAEQRRVNQQMAEMELHQQLYQINRGECPLSYQRKAIFDSLWFQYVQQRWVCLYNTQQEHHDWEMHVPTSLLSFLASTEDCSRAFVVSWQQPWLSLQFVLNSNQWLLEVLLMITRVIILYYLLTSKCLILAVPLHQHRPQVGVASLVSRQSSKPSVPLQTPSY